MGDRYYDRLYGFQRTDVEKLAQVPSGLDASDMGTGKSYKGVAYDEVVNPDRPTLLVAPLGTLIRWKQHFEAAGHTMDIVDPKARALSFESWKKADHKVFGVHWHGLRLMPELKKVPWGLKIGDECHYMQNRKSQMNMHMKWIQAPRKLLMSGTPISSDPAMFWAILHELYPKQWSSYWNYFKRYVDADLVKADEEDKGYFRKTGPKNVDELLSLIDPYYVRHLKKAKCHEDHPEGVMPWLKDKYYSVEWVTLEGKQLKAYNQMKKEMVAWVGAQETKPLIAAIVVVKLMRLQQFADAYADVDTIYKLERETGEEVPYQQVTLTEPSAKIDRLLSIIEDNPTKPLVVWTQFSQMVRLVYQRLRKVGVPTSLYYGGNRATRDKEKDDFIEGRTQIFLGTPQSGGVGVDGLQWRADTCIFLDRPWGALVNQQAEDRLWRDGQANAVQVCDIMASNTVDLGRKQRIEQSWNWIRTLLGDTRWLQEQESKDEA
jgi:SNF2 family DNA or RNA helicase